LQLVYKKLLLAHRRHAAARSGHYGLEFWIQTLFD
jgi:hypothetical protein